MLNDAESHLDITRNVKVIDFLKGEMLTDMAELFKLMSREGKDVEDATIDIIANIIIESYVLAKRMGISYDSIDLQVKEKLRVGIEENNDIEKWYKDLSSLCNFIQKR